MTGRAHTERIHLLRDDCDRRQRESSVTVFYLLLALQLWNSRKVGKACHVPSIFSYTMASSWRRFYARTRLPVNKRDLPLSLIELHYPFVCSSLKSLRFIMLFTDSHLSAICSNCGSYKERFALTSAIVKEE